MRIVHIIISLLITSSFIVGQSFETLISDAKICSDKRIEQINCLKTILNNKSIPLDTIALIHYSISFRYRAIKKYEESIEYGLKADHCYRYADPCISTAQKNLRILARNYIDLNQLDSAMIYLEKIDYNMPPSSDSWAYMEAAGIYSELLLDYELYHLAYELLRPLYLSQHYYRLDKKEKLNFLYNMMKLFRSSSHDVTIGNVENLLDQVKSLTLHSEAEKSEYMKIVLEYGQYLINNKRDKDALKVWQELLEEYGSVNCDECRNTLSNVLTNLAFVTDRLKMYSEMKDYAVASSSYADSDNVQNNYASKLNYAMSLKHDGNYEDAIKAIEEVFLILNTKRYSQKINPSFLFELFNLYLDLTLIELHFNNEYESQKAFQFMIKIANTYIDSRFFEKSKLPLKSKLFNKTASLLDSLHVRNLNSEFVILSELLTSSVLLDNISLDKIYPESIAQSISELESEFSSSNYSLSELAQKQRIALSQLINEDLYKRSEQNAFLIQNEIEEDVEIWMFRYTKDFLYLVSLTQDSIMQKKLGEADYLRRMIDSVIASIKSGKKVNAEFPSLNLANSNIQNLVVIPDGNINSLPLDYILDSDINVSMSPSISVFRMLKSRDNTFSEVWLESPIVESGNYVNKAFNPNYVKESNMIGDYDKMGNVIYHFSGHGYSALGNNDYSYLEKKSGRLTRDQVASLDLSSPLVVLSACETGIGDVIPGEGVMSLSRAFLQAGASSVVQTLWKVDAQSTDQIISYFYEYLLQGQRKSEALWNAKQKFLKTCPDRMKDPYYWAGIVIIGNDDPLIFKPKNNHLIWVVSFTGLVLLLLTPRIKRFYAAA